MGSGSTTGGGSISSGDISAGVMGHGAMRRYLIANGGPDLLSGVLFRE